MPRSRRRMIALLAIAVLSGTSPASAWGREGHRIVARIAAWRLTPAAREKVAAILGTTPTGVEAAMVAASTWPDDIDRTATGTRGWHFIDVSVTNPFSVASLCPRHDCVVDRINEIARRLGTNATGFSLARAPSPPRPVTSQEAAFLIHFVGDIHQPLHAANNGDRGGNCVPLMHPIIHADGSRDTTELHAAWDVDEVLAVFKTLGDEMATSKALFQRSRSTPVAQRTPIEWARESNDLARRDIYQKLRLPAHTAPPGQCATGIAGVDVTQAYLDSNVADVERQLIRAGVRLANLINQVCSVNGCRPF